MHHRVSRISQDPSVKAAHRAAVSPEAGSAASSSASSPHDQSTSSSTPVSSVSDPPALPGPIPPVLLETEHLLQKFVASMPPIASTLKGPGGIPPYNASRRPSTDQGGVDSTCTASTADYGVHPTVFSLNTILYTTFLLLYEEMAQFEGPEREVYEAKASQAGVAAVSMVGSIIDIDFGELDLLLVFFWKNIARFLLERVKKLRRQGLDQGTSLKISYALFVGHFPKIH
jgi:hypothetical protein